MDSSVKATVLEQRRHQSRMKYVNNFDCLLHYFVNYSIKAVLKSKKNSISQLQLWSMTAASCTLFH